MMSLILKWRVDRHWELLFILTLSKYFLSCCAITFHIFISYQITSNKGQCLTHMVLRVCSMKVAAISSTRWNPQTWFSAVSVCWITVEWQTDWTTLKNTLSIEDKSMATLYAGQQDITDWYFDLFFTLFKFHTLLANTHVSPAHIIIMSLIHPRIITFIIQRRLWSVCEWSKANNELL